MRPLRRSGVVTVYVDDGCGRCRRAAGLASRADRAGRLRLCGLADGASLAPAEDLLAELHAVDGSGRLVRGYDAVTAVVGALPGGGLLGPLMEAGPVRWAGTRLYRRVARRRRRDGGAV